MRRLYNFLLNMLAVLLADFLLDDMTIFKGFSLSSFLSLAWISLLFSAINTFLMPLLKLITLPLRLLTFGFFTFVINGALLFLVSIFFPEHLRFDSALAAVKASVCIALISFLLSVFAKNK